ncbi:galectin-1-like isoform X2 [Antennarius striatus]
MDVQIKNASLRAGDQLKVRGFIPHDAERFQIEMGSDANDLGLHFNPRFHDDTDGSVVVCNSKADGCWGEEQREMDNPLQRGTDVKIVVKLAGEMFEVELPEGHEIMFPNRDNVDVIDYIKITGDFKLTSFKIC